jgi:hypothetical protein
MMPGAGHGVFALRAREVHDHDRTGGVSALPVVGIEQKRRAGRGRSADGGAHVGQR